MLGEPVGCCPLRLGAAHHDLGIAELDVCMQYLPYTLGLGHGDGGAEVLQRLHELLGLLLGHVLLESLRHRLDKLLRLGVSGFCGAQVRVWVHGRARASVTGG